MGTILKGHNFNKTFILVSSTDHISPLLGARPTAVISKNGQPFAPPQGFITELSNGWYVISYTSIDTNTLGELALHVTAPGADNTDAVDQIITSLFLW